MKQFGSIVGFIGLTLVLAAGSWLKLAFAWWSTGAGLCLMGVGLVLAGIGGASFTRGSAGAEHSDQKPLIQGNAGCHSH
jgi:hypothetical protein